MSRLGYSLCAMTRAARARSMSASGRDISRANSDSDGSASISNRANETGQRPSAAGSVMDPGSLERGGLQLFRQFERARRGLARQVLRVRRRRMAKEQRPAQLVMEPLVRLDDVAVERRRDTVAGTLAELDELAVLHDGDGLAGD